MTEPDSAERQRKIAWITSVRDRTEREREIARIVATHMAEWKHGIAIHITGYILVVTFLLIVVALDGIPIFTAKMAWAFIVITALAALYELWG